MKLSDDVREDLKAVGVLAATTMIFIFLPFTPFIMSVLLFMVGFPQTNRVGILVMLMFMAILVASVVVLLRSYTKEP